MYEKLSKAASFIQEKTDMTPKIGVLLGSGLGAFVNELSNQTVISYSEIPFFPKTNVEGHEGRITFGEIEGSAIVTLQGRLHVYDGHPMDDIVFPIRTLATLGIEYLLLTNASGGINESFTPGDLILISDHINMLGQNPLAGPLFTEFGTKLPDMSKVYHPTLIEYFKEAASKINYELKEGVYCSVLGPTYETAAEVRMLRTLGADIVGMSTVPEAIAANHLGLKVGGLSCVTNMSTGIEVKSRTDDKKEQAQNVLTTFSSLLKSVVKSLDLN